MTGNKPLLKDDIWTIQINEGTVNNKEAHALGFRAVPAEILKQTLQGLLDEMDSGKVILRKMAKTESEERMATALIGQIDIDKNEIKRWLGAVVE